LNSKIKIEIGATFVGMLLVVGVLAFSLTSHLQSADAKKDKDKYEKLSENVTKKAEATVGISGRGYGDIFGSNINTSSLIGIDGADGTSVMGVDGVKGIDGADGTSVMGVDGVKGIDGADGTSISEIGANGVNGTDGADGTSLMGADGVNGTDGADGTSISGMGTNG
jgi:hypothetical protein